MQYKAWRLIEKIFYTALLEYYLASFPTDIGLFSCLFVFQPIKVEIVAAIL